MSTIAAGYAGIDELIWSHPDYRGGRPCIAGTGIAISTIGVLWSEGLTVEEIADEKSIPLEEASAAVAFYLHNKAAFDAELVRRTEIIDRLGEEHHRTYGFPG